MNYLPVDQRVSRTVAEAAITEYFPGVSIAYLKAILIAMGVAESGGGMVPMLWATGPTGAAKSTTIRIVLEMLAEKWESMSEIPEERLDQIFGEALEETRAIVFDDFAKEPEDYKRLHTFFIRLTRGGHSYHKLHHGKRTVPMSSAIFLTDWRTPSYFLNDPQFGRRTHIVRLNVVPNWEKMGRKVESWWMKTAELQAAAETFFSYVIDDFFPDGDAEGFDVKMQRLGIHQLLDETGEDAHEHKSSLRELVYDLVMGICTMRSVNPIEEKRLGRGYREVIWKTQGTIGQACTDLVESLGAAKLNMESLNHVLEQFKGDLQDMFGLHGPATLQLRDYGAKTFIRLVEEGVRAHDRTKRINEELFPVWPLPATHRAEALTPKRVNGHANGHHMNGHTNGHAHLVKVEPKTDFDYNQPPQTRAAFNLPQFSAIQVCAVRPLARDD